MRLALCALTLLFQGGCSSRGAGVDSRAAADRSALDGAAADAPRDGAPRSELTVDVARGQGLCPPAFQPCGGDLSGAWNILTFCPEDEAAAQALYEHPYDDRKECQRPQNFVIAEPSWPGTVRFEGGTATISYVMTVKVTYGFNQACLAVIFREALTPTAACASLQKPGKLTCSFDAAKVFCTCTGTVPAPETRGTAPYAVTGPSRLTLDGQPISFCRTGDRLTLDWEQHPVSWRWWLLQRQ